MKKIIKRAVASVLSLVIAISVGVTPVFAATHETQDNATMTPVVKVYEIGEKSFYQVNNDGSIQYADRDIEGYSFKAIPSAYISGSEYNEGNVAYGMYAVTVEVNGEPVVKVHTVPLSECIVQGGNYYFDHATEASATVSEEVDTATNVDPTMSTQFYIRIENGIDPDGVTTEDVVSGNATADARINYEITVAQKATYQLEATVPMYVCMYGYRGTGNIVTPTSDAYQLKNYSTQNNNDSAWISNIVKLTTFTQIIDEDHSNEELYAIAYKEGEGYTWWYSNPNDGNGFDENYYDEYTRIKDIENVDEVTASGEQYVIFINREWHFCPAGLLENGVLRETVSSVDYELERTFTYNGFEFSTYPAVNDEGTYKGTEGKKGLAIRISELQAEPATWKVVPMETTAAKLSRGELVMTLAPDENNANFPYTAQHDASAIDLADCSAPLDITERGWFMGAPILAADGSVATPTILPLITKAQMAGGNVNAAGCAPVVKVTYTIVPVFNEADAYVSGMEII